LLLPFWQLRIPS